MHTIYELYIIYVYTINTHILYTDTIYTYNNIQKYIHKHTFITYIKKPKLIDVRTHMGTAGIIVRLHSGYRVTERGVNS